MPPSLPLILAIDTSCDETSVAVTYGPFYLSNVVASQTQLHKQYGGVFPTVAKQAHRENLPKTVAAALRLAKVGWNEIDLIAVTQGPGLAPALEVGIEFVKQLAQTHQKPMLGVNHIAGHVWSWAARPWPRRQPKPHSSQLTLPAQSTHPNQLLTTPDWLNQLDHHLPALAVVISGGHSEFILVSKNTLNPAATSPNSAQSPLAPLTPSAPPFIYHRLGWTIDDAAGECLDKVGRLLDLGYPAGPVIEQFAKYGDATRFVFPLPMTTSGDYNLSFSGLKTHARNLLEKLNWQQNFSKQDTYDFCASFQQAVVRAITYKLKKILTNQQTGLNSPIKEIWLGGGVAVNQVLRKQIRKTVAEFNSNHLNFSKTLTESHMTLPEIKKIIFRQPHSARLCGDNAAMIGVAAGLTSPFPIPKYQKNSHPALDRLPNWKISEN